MSKLLIHENPLMVLPSLAVKIGLNEAIFVQQIHYWIQNSDKVHDGKRWTYNTYIEWQKQFPFWSDSTLKRIVKNLRELNIIEVGNFNKAGFDKTNWYTINYECLPSHYDAMVVSNGNLVGVNVTQPIPKTSTKTSTNIKNTSSYSEEFETFWKTYPNKTGKKKAYDKYSKLVKAYSPERILDGCIKYSNDTKGTEPKYIKHATTWLNGEHFNDYSENTRQDIVVSDNIESVSTEDWLNNL